MASRFFFRRLHRSTSCNRGLCRTTSYSRPSSITAIDFPPITVPWILIQGEQDEIVSSEAVFKWIETLNPKPTLIRIPDTGHFFHGKLLELRSLLEAALKKSQTKLEK